MALHESVLKRIHVAARVKQHLHDSLGSRGVFQNASILAFVSPRFCLQSLSFAILRRSPLASPPSSPPTFLVVPHSLSIPSIVRNLGKFSNPIPLLVIFDRRFLVTPSESRPQTRCNRRARPKEKFRLHSRSLAPTPLCVLFICSYTPLILQVRLYISNSAQATIPLRIIFSLWRYSVMLSHCPKPKPRVWLRTPLGTHVSHSQL